MPQTKIQNKSYPTTKKVELQLREAKLMPEKKLGELIKVSTTIGRIDVLTEDEIIEVKKITDWKAALGQILIYSGFYPEHRKLIYLYGSAKELKKLPDIETACLSFNILVTSSVLAGGNE
jgi:hypothetical protein